jgi:hypothetical protein
LSSPQTHPKSPNPINPNDKSRYLYTRLTSSIPKRLLSR